MKNLFELGNQYAKESDWKDIPLMAKVYKIMMRDNIEINNNSTES